MTNELANKVYDVLVEEAGMPNTENSRKLYCDLLSEGWNFALDDDRSLFCKPNGSGGFIVYATLETPERREIIERTNKRLAELVE
jgi:hypothetical protein